MKWCYFVWFFLFSTFGSPLAENIVIIRNDLVNSPGTSQDTFIVPNSQCVNGGPRCDSFGATQAIANSEQIPNCHCVCGKEGQMQTTFYFQENSWKCIRDDILRTHSGVTVMFRNEKAGIFTFRVGQWSYFADLTVATSGKCQIRMSLSSFLQCNGTWAPLPLTGIYIISISGDDHYLQLNGAPGLEGRIIKMAIQCPLLQRIRYVVFKLKGTLKCSSMYPVTPSIRSTVSSSKSIAVPVVTTTQHATRSATLTILATRTITSSPSGKTTTVLDLKTSRHMTQALTSSPEPAKRNGNETEKDNHIYDLIPKDDGGVSVVVIVTAVLTSFLVGILLISIIMLRRRRCERQRARKTTKRTEDLATDGSELELQPSVHQEDRYPEISPPSSEREEATGEYDYALPEMPVKQHNYYMVAWPAENRREDDVNNTDKNTINQRTDGLGSNQRNCYNISDINSKENSGCDAADRTDSPPKEENKLDCSNAEESASCNRKLSERYHTYDTAGSIIPYGIANDSNDYHVYDVLEGPNPNFDYSRRLTENRVYGEIENLRFEEDELCI